MIAGASITLEWSVDDFAISRFADSLGDTATAAEFQNRAQYWQNLFNPATGYISPRNADGAFPLGPGFVQPIWGFGQDGFDEGNAEQYLWLVPQNVAGLVTALGGRQAVADRLDRFLTELNAGPNKPFLWAGNEPDFGVPWLYNYIGQPWKTQETVNRVRSELFGPTPDGEPGNDDLGAQSSWYVWAALGLFPSTPGTPILTVNTPLFDRAQISVPGGKSIRIFAPGASGRNGLKYINGLQHRRPGHRSDIPSGIDHPHRRRPTFSLSATPNIGLGHCRVLRATVVRRSTSAVTAPIVRADSHGSVPVSSGVGRGFADEFLHSTTPEILCVCPCPRRACVGTVTKSRSPNGSTVVGAASKRIGTCFRHTWDCMSVGGLMVSTGWDTARRRQHDRCGGAPRAHHRRRLAPTARWRGTAPYPQSRNPGHLRLERAAPNTGSRRPRAVGPASRACGVGSATRPRRPRGAHGPAESAPPAPGFQQFIFPVDFGFSPISGSPRRSRFVCDQGIN